MKVYELETKNGRVFRVIIVNDSQQKKLRKLINDNETFVRVEVVINGVHDIKQFTQLCSALQ